jgi:hypothetical protein
MCALRLVVHETSTVIEDERRGEHVAALSPNAGRLSLEDERRYSNHQPLYSNHRPLYPNHQPLVV